MIIMNFVEVNVLMKKARSTVIPEKLQQQEQ